MSFASNKIQFQDLVAQLDEAAVRRLALELLRRQPAAFADLVEGELANPAGEQVPPQPNPQPEDGPDWCFCGCCVPTQEENKCCCRRVMPCITTNPLFQQLVLDGNVLDIAMRYKENVLVADHARNNKLSSCCLSTVCVMAIWTSRPR